MFNETREDVPPPSTIIIRGRWRILRKIGEGAFGDIFVAKNVNTGEPVAIKVESVESKKQVLKLEVVALKKLQHSPYACRFLACGRHANFNYIVMELQGSSLSELRRQQAGQRFSMLTTLKLGMEILKAVMAVHEAGYLHRDLKPSNVLMGRGKSRQRVFLIDFGLARKHLTSTGEVRASREVVGFRGTARYASLDSHLGHDLGRKDDIWSLLYMMVEFLNGQLGWSHLKERDEIGEEKLRSNGPGLVAGLPPEFHAWREHLESLKYESVPDYTLLYTMLSRAFESYGGDENTPWDWEACRQIGSSPGAGRGVAPGPGGYYSPAHVRRGPNESSPTTLNNRPRRLWSKSWERGVKLPIERPLAHIEADQRAAGEISIKSVGYSTATATNNTGMFVTPLKARLATPQPRLKSLHRIQPITPTLPATVNAMTPTKQTGGDDGNDDDDDNDIDVDDGEEHDDDNDGAAGDNNNDEEKDEYNDEMKDSKGKGNVGMPAPPPPPSPLMLLDGNKETHDDLSMPPPPIAPHVSQRAIAPTVPIRRVQRPVSDYPVYSGLDHSIDAGDSVVSNSITFNSTSQASSQSTLAALAFTASAAQRESRLRMREQRDEFFAEPVSPTRNAVGPSRNKRGVFSKGHRRHGSTGLVRGNIPTLDYTSGSSRTRNPSRRVGTSQGPQHHQQQHQQQQQQRNLFSQSRSRSPSPVRFGSQSASVSPVPPQLHGNRPPNIRSPPRQSVAHRTYSPTYAYPAPLSTITQTQGYGHFHHHHQQQQQQQQQQEEEVVLQRAKRDSESPAGVQTKRRLFSSSPAPSLSKSSGSDTNTVDSGAPSAQPETASPTPSSYRPMITYASAPVFGHNPPPSPSSQIDLSRSDTTVIARKLHQRRLHPKPRRATDGMSHSTVSYVGDADENDDDEHCDDDDEQENNQGVARDCSSDRDDSDDGGDNSRDDDDDDDDGVDDDGDDADDDENNDDDRREYGNDRVDGRNNGDGCDEARSVVVGRDDRGVANGTLEEIRGSSESLQDRDVDAVALSPRMPTNIKLPEREEINRRREMSPGPCSPTSPHSHPSTPTLRESSENSKAHSGSLRIAEHTDNRPCDDDEEALVAAVAAAAAASPQRRAKSPDPRSKPLDEDDVLAAKARVSDKLLLAGANSPLSLSSVSLKEGSDDEMYAIGDRELIGGPPLLDTQAAGGSGSQTGSEAIPTPRGKARSNKRSTKGEKTKCADCAIL